MKRFVCILAIPAVVCAILLLNLVTFKVGIGTAHACGTYKINGSTTVVLEKSNAALISFSLWYDSCKQQNFTSADITFNSENTLSVTVCRNPGNGLPRLCATRANCPSTGVCDGPGVYSPNNTAFAQIDTSSVTVQTSSF